MLIVLLIMFTFKKYETIICIQKQVDIIQIIRKEFSLVYLLCYNNN